MAPKVSVVMSVYNGECYLREAVESILNQTFTDFQFVIVDDGSADTTVSILESYKDARIRLLTNEQNLGLTRSLNRALLHATGEFIARIDADDIALPERLSKQVAYLDAHPEVGLIGSAIWSVDVTGRRVLKTVPTQDVIIRWCLLFSNCINHPTALFRRSLLERVGVYDSNIRYAQDYELWSRFSRMTRLANLPDPLVIQDTSNLHRITHGKLSEQWRSGTLTAADNLRSLLPFEPEVSYHNSHAPAGGRESNEQLSRGLNLSQINAVRHTWTGLKPRPDWRAVSSQRITDWMRALLTDFKALHKQAVRSSAVDKWLSRYLMRMAAHWSFEDRGLALELAKFGLEIDRTSVIGPQALKLMIGLGSESEGLHSLLSRCKARLVR